MTVGQRIAQRRKSLGLSQEALGEQLGVSRQAIYKWEADAALPEIEKLINLSRIFSVSVGWLLGVEEQAERPEGELSEEQLRMVREIVDQYLASRPEPERPKKRRRWPVVLTGCVVTLGIAAAFSSLSIRLDRVTGDYNTLRQTVGELNGNINTQIGSVAGQVEDILNRQNQLTASWDVRVDRADLLKNTVYFKAQAVPKTYVEGMTAVFLVESEGMSREIPAVREEGGLFSAELSCPLSDSISVSVAFLEGERRETQLLERYNYLYTDSFPYVNLFSWLWVGSDGMLSQCNGEVQVLRNNQGPLYAAPKEIRLGLFRDRKLVYWCRQEDQLFPDAEDQTIRYTKPEGEYAPEPGHRYCLAAIVTDTAGRERILCDSSMQYSEDQGWYTDTAEGIVEIVTDPGDWEY